MMRMWKVSAAALALCATTPVLADQYFAVTPSGAAEMQFPQKAPRVVAALSGKCIDAHWTVVSSGSNELVCEAPLNMGQSILGQMLMGNSYSTPPRRFFRFNIAETGGVSRVQASGWVELQMAFGQMKRTDFTGPEFHNSIVSFMASAGGKFPVGTRFPNHVVLGIKGDDVPVGKYIGLKVTEVEPGSPAAKAGLQPDDIVQRVARKPFKNLNDYLDATAKAAAAPTYEVEYSRGGQIITASFERSFRPAVTEPVVAEADAADAAPTAQAQVSVADELEKLVKLKNSGVLSAAEFDAQKQKLLSR